MFNNLFLKAGSVDVDAAVLGIGRERWVSAKLEENEVDVLNRMKDNRFDILPIENNKDAPIYSYYYFESTAETIEEKQIVYEDLISANTPAIDIIEKFVRKNRSFFFLTHENQIAGLITFSELKWDKYGGRVLSDVKINNKSLAKDLINNGLGREYHGEKKQSWCKEI